MAISTDSVLLPVATFDINGDRSSAAFRTARESGGLVGGTAWDDTARLGVPSAPVVPCVEEVVRGGTVAAEEDAEDEEEDEDG